MSPVSLILSLFLCLWLQGCSAGSSSSTVDTSSTGSVAGIVGGIVNSSSATGTLSHFRSEENHSRSACPTMETVGTGCGNAGLVYTLTYSGCTFGSSSATWTGTQLVTLTSGSASCGTFPTVSFARTFGSGTTRTSSSGLVVTLDTSTNSDNFESTSFGGGTTVTFSGGHRTQINISGIKVTSSAFDFTVRTSSPLSISDTGATKTVSGSVEVLHNLLHVRGSSTLTSLTFSAGCCFPTGGSISTLFDVGTSGGNLASRLIGKTETMSFSATCGQATYTDYTGAISTVTLTHCL